MAFAYGHSRCPSGHRAYFHWPSMPYFQAIVPFRIRVRPSNQVRLHLSGLSHLKKASPIANEDLALQGTIPYTRLRWLPSQAVESGRCQQILSVCLPMLSSVLHTTLIGRKVPGNIACKYPPTRLRVHPDLRVAPPMAPEPPSSPFSLPVCHRDALQFLYAAHFVILCS